MMQSTLNDKGTLHNTVYIKGFTLHEMIQSTLVDTIYISQLLESVVNCCLPYLLNNTRLAYLVLLQLNSSTLNDKVTLNNTVYVN